MIHQVRQNVAPGYTRARDPLHCWRQLVGYAAYLPLHERVGR
jgi:hypothetical protein